MDVLQLVRRNLAAETAVQSKSFFGRISRESKRGWALPAPTRFFPSCPADDGVNAPNRHPMAAEMARRTHYFGGLSAKEIADVLSADETSVSQRTVENDLNIARAKLYGWMKTDQPA